MGEESIYLEKPARKWDDGFPIGNGRLGAMVMGQVREETIIINEETLCYGPPRQRENADAYTHLQEIRELLLEGSVERAAFVAKMAMTGTPKYNNPYQPVGDLRLCFMHCAGKEKNYQRKLNLDTAIAEVNYEINDNCYSREYFVSQAYGVLAIRIRAKGAQKITMSANISRKPFEEYTGVLDDKTAANWGENGSKGMHYLSAVRIAAPETKKMGDFVYIEDQEEVVLYLAAMTDYESCLAGKRQEEEIAYEKLKEAILIRLEDAQKAGYEVIKERHIRDYQKVYHAFSFHLDVEESTEQRPLDKQIQDVRDGDSMQTVRLTERLVQYARYLMISSSLDCLLPANLQGIWNGSYEPPWQSQYTININTQMNYWFVEKAGLKACHLPLFGLVHLLAKNGTKTAKQMYHSRGFCAHHNTNVWGCSAPEGIFDASPYWVMGGAWLCLHMYEHYLYTMDVQFLEKEALPLMREAIRFFEDYLYEDKAGYLVSGPVVSPENTYRSCKGEKGALCMGTTMDNSILRQLISSYLEGVQYIEKRNQQDEESLLHVLGRLTPLSITKDGRIKEWMEDYEEIEPGHRHISHLYGLYPGHEITSKDTRYFEAAKKTLEYRLSHGGGHTGWSRAWLACFAARLKDGEQVADHIKELLCKCIQDNLLDSHPPFQIDGNFGIAEAILEAVVQNHRGTVELLPALPKAWSQGSVKGMCLEGNVRLCMTWKDYRPIEVLLCAKEEQVLNIIWKKERQTVRCLGGRTMHLTFGGDYEENNNTYKEYEK